MSIYILNKARILLPILFLFSIFQVNAIGLSSFRIYLDKQHTKHNFVVYNREADPQVCTIKTRHFLFDKTGSSSLYKGDDIPNIAADPWLRYSPRQFVLAPGEIQNVRFQMRRKSNMEPKEYRSFIALQCGYDEETLKKQTLKSNVQVKPILRHNIPVIVRTGELPAEIYFDNISVTNNKLNLTFNKIGERSTYGELLLVDKDSDKVIDKTLKVSLQLETEKKDFTLSLAGYDVNDLALKFVEDKLLSGDQVIKYPLSNINTLSLR